MKKIISLLILQILLLNLSFAQTTQPVYVPTIVTTATLGSAGARVSILPDGRQTVSIQVTGTFSGTLTPYVSSDGGTTITATQFFNVNTQTVMPTVTSPGTYQILDIGGAPDVIVIMTSYTSGSANVIMSASMSPPALVNISGNVTLSNPTVNQGTGASTTPWYFYLYDGTNILGTSTHPAYIQGNVTSSQGSGASGNPWYFYLYDGTNILGTSTHPAYIQGSVTANEGGTWNVGLNAGTNNIGSVNALQSGTWTVQPGNTQNTTPWLTKDSANGTVSPGTVATDSELMGCIFNTTLPSFTNGQGGAMQCDSSGRLLVNVSNSSIPINGTVTVTQATASNLNAEIVGAGVAGTPAGGVVSVQGVSGGTPVPVSGTFWQATQPVSGTVTVTQSTASSLKASLPDVEAGLAPGTAPSDMFVEGLIYNSGGITLSNGQTAALQGDASGYLEIDCKTGCAGSGGTSATDESAFTYGTSSYTPIGGVYNSTITSLSSGQGGAAALTSSRSLHVTPYTSGGTEEGTSGSPLYVQFGSAQPISGSVTANQGSSGTSAWKTTDAANGTVSPGTAPSNSELIGCISNYPLPNFNNGQVGAVQCTSQGQVRTIVDNSSITSNQGAPNGISNSWPVEVTDGTNVLGTRTNPNIVGGSPKVGPTIPTLNFGLGAPPTYTSNIGSGAFPLLSSGTFFSVSGSPGKNLYITGISIGCFNTSATSQSQITIFVGRATSLSGGTATQVGTVALNGNNSTASGTTVSFYTYSPTVTASYMFFRYAILTENSATAGPASVQFDINTEKYGEPIIIPSSQWLTILDSVSGGNPYCNVSVTWMEF